METLEMMWAVLALLGPPAIIAYWIGYERGRNEERKITPDWREWNE